MRSGTPSRPADSYRKGLVQLMSTLDVLPMIIVIRL
jgi:hypothetical protein